MADKLVIVDGNSIFYRSFYALPLLTNLNGEYSNAVYGFAIQIIHIIQDIKPKYIAVAFDASKKSFRNELYADYKATRKPMPDELRSQIEPLKKMLRLMNIECVEKEGLEGDDIIGILSKKFLDTQTIIVTGDRDSFQLVDDITSVYFTKKGTSDVKVMTPAMLKSEYGVSPKEFIDLKALQGDSSDNIPGVAGIGPKTALQLIDKYGSLDGIYSHIDEISGKVKDKLIANKDMAYLSKELATIVTKGDLDVTLKECEYDFPFSGRVLDFFKYYDFKSLIKKEDCFNLLTGEKIETKYEVVEYNHKEKLQIVTDLIEKVCKFAVFFDNYDIHIAIDNKEIIFHIANDLFGLDLTLDDFFAKFKPIFENENIEKICYDSKKDMYYLKQANAKLNNYFDCSVAKYLVDGSPVDAVKDIFYDGELNNIAVRLLKFSEEYKAKIETNNLAFLYYDVENKLSNVLFSMEEAGFKIDQDILETLRKKYELEQTFLENKIFELAGEKFNINSTKQLSHILYEKLGLSHSKKMSTDAEHLQAIEHEHEVISYILRFRKVSKFLSTYILGILPHIDSNGKIHTYFKQTFTTTGRLSSIEPNLQNIPIRGDESREIRSMFIASSDENVLIDADYSQIELRLLAHLSDDPIFVDAFKNKVDIHTKTAANIFGVAENEVTSIMRRTAKIVNFGIIYGISEHGLSEDLKISYQQAREYIENYYAKHPAIRKFMDKMVADAKQTGVAKTIFGRTRKMPEITSTNYNVRTRAERASQNMPLQGSAADIIKIAMVRTYEALKNGGYKAKLIMQVHDELIIDCPIDEKSEVIKILVDEMENACKLSIPLEVDAVSSFRWSDGH